MDNTKDLFEIWVEYLRPKTFDELILPERFKVRFNKFIENKTIPNLMFISNSPGTGKTSSARILLRELGAEVLRFNGSSERGIGNIRTTVEDFTKKGTMTGNLKVVLIEEADGLTPEALMSLKDFIEDEVNNVRFIFTCNDEYQIFDAIRSRFIKIHFEFDENEQKDMMNLFMERIISFLEEEKISFDTKVLVKIIREYYPDFREAIQEMNDIYYSTGEIKEFRKAINKKIIENLINAMNESNIDGVIKIISESPSINWKMIYSHLMKNRNLFTKISAVELICTLADWQYKNTFIPDKVVNFLGCCSDIILQNKG